MSRLLSLSAACSLCAAIAATARADPSKAAVPASVRAEAPEALYAAAADAVKASFKPSFDRVAALKNVYQVLRLMDERGAFTVPQLENKGLVDPFEPAAFVDKVVAFVEER